MIWLAETVTQMLNTWAYIMERQLIHLLLNQNVVKNVWEVSQNRLY